jgi:hypothetical protein
MFKYLSILTSVIVTSFYLFPFDFAFLPGINTKLVMAIISIPLLMSDVAAKRTGHISKDFLIVSLFALSVSFTSLFAVIYNNTNDYCYVTYIISMMVWLGGAYTLIRMLKWVHGSVSVNLLFNYLFAVCVIQCLVAVAISRMLVIENFVSSFYSGYKDLKEFADGRLYGVGCAFDVAGMRLSTIEIIFGCLIYDITRRHTNRSWITGLYYIGFVIIAVVGNMIARSTVIGLIIALFIILYSSSIHKDKISSLMLKWMFGILVLGILFCIFAYHYDQNFRMDIRFAFEGFFSLAESGKWEVHSNDVLMTMYRFPESVKTWIVGDGYFLGTINDPYYTGIDYKGYYMSTDVGYLRFIYYSGVIGLGAFVLFMFKVASVCKKRFPKYKLVFITLLVLQLVIWFKVASDIFSIFALFLVVSWLQDDNDSILEENTV